MNRTKPDTKLITSDEAAQIIFGDKSKQRTVIKMIRSGELGGGRVRGVWLTSQADIELMYRDAKREVEYKQDHKKAVKEVRTSKRRKRDFIGNDGSRLTFKQELDAITNAAKINTN